MAGEIVEGKATLIQRAGRRAFELPAGHTIRLRDDLGEYGQCVELNTPGEGVYSVDRVEDLDDRVVVHVAQPLGEHGPVGVGEGPMPEVRGYPFMDD
jgi:hypothetical protein